MTTILMSDFTEHLDKPKLADEERDRMEGPITPLIIVHFKAAPNVIAKRIESSLSNLVHSGHNGFIKGR